MRLWKGKEMEGPNIGLDTLFIEAEWVCDKQDVHKITDAIQKHMPKALYFGAGRVDTQFEGLALGIILEFGTFLGLKYTIETTELNFVTQFAPLLLKHNVTIVHRTDVHPTEALQLFMDRLVVNKIDDCKQVCMSKFTTEFKTDITMVVDGRYDGVDTLIED